jgi:uncharacterized BrkB/YihY/UPF0761 family membrane protein
MLLKGNSPKQTKQSDLTLTVFAITGLVGLITFLIVLGAVFGGLALDDSLGTRPKFTLIFVVISIPISLVVMVTLLRVLMKRIKPSIPKPDAGKQKEENQIGGH